MRIHHDIDSSHIKGIDYDDEQKHFDVEFHTGLTYRYHDFTAEELKDFLASESKGKHLHAKVKPGHRVELLTGG